MARDESRLILLMGSPRSGTTWLAKIFDSHPRVIYRHEPDSVLKSVGLPFVPELAEVDKWRAQARDYLAELQEVRATKTAGSLPMFRKQYRGVLREYCRRLYINVAKAFEAVVEKFGVKISIQIPDWILHPTIHRPVYVLKSVDSLTRTYLFSSAAPAAKVVHIIRHPCAFVASEIRGEKLNVMQIETFLSTQVKMSQAIVRGLDMVTLQAMSREQQLASLWMLQNEKVMHEMAKNPNYRVVVYEDLCRSPADTARELFEFCDLEWDEQTQHFISRSTNYQGGGNERYFQVVRDPLKAAFKWRNELDDKQVNSILEVVSGSAPGRLYDQLSRVSLDGSLKHIHNCEGRDADGNINVSFKV